jgi:uncharacterized membrane protein YcfT
VPVIVVWLIAAGLEMAPVETGWTIVDEFAARFVYFYTGYVAANYLFTLAADAQAKPASAIASLLLWGSLNGLLVANGYAEWPLISLTLGLLGAGAVITFAALLAQARIVDWLRYCGEHSIVIYLSFFLFMAATRILLIKAGIISSIGLMSVIVTAAGVIGPVILFWMVRNTPLRFLFARPDRFWLTPRRVVLQPAE